VLRAVDEFGVPMAILAAARELYSIARNLGLDEQVFAIVAEALRQK